MAFGLPRIPGVAQRAINIGVIGAIQSAIWNYLAEPLTWGVFESGTDEPAIEVDSVIRTVKSSSSDVTNFPVVDGSFSSFNKVNKPDEHRITMSKSGTPDERNEFLEWLEENKAEATLFDIATPEATYENLTLRDFTISRDVKEGTVTMIIAECTFVEVRQAPIVYYNAAQGKADTTEAQEPGDTPTEPGKFSGAVEYIANGVNTAVEKVTGVVEKLQGDVNKIINSL